MKMVRSRAGASVILESPKGEYRSVAADAVPTRFGHLNGDFAER
jgi:hypothetical protein